MAAHADTMSPLTDRLRQCLTNMNADEDDAIWSEYLDILEQVYHMERAVRGVAGNSPMANDDEGDAEISTLIEEVAELDLNGASGDAPSSPGVKPARNSWLAKNGFKHTSRHASDFSSETAFVEHMRAFAQQMANKFSGRGLPIQADVNHRSLRIVPIQQLRFKTSPSAGAPVASISGELVISASVSLYLGLCIAKPNRGGPSSKWFSVGDLVLFCLRKDRDELLRECGGKDSRLNLVLAKETVSVDVVHMTRASREVLPDLYVRARDPVPVVILAPYASVLSKVGITRPDDFAGISKESIGSLSLSDILTIHQGCPPTAADRPPRRASIKEESSAAVPA